MNNTYNTGRVHIGCNYQPNVKPYHDADALRLQDALLGNKRSIDADGIAIVCVCIFIALVAVLV